MGINYTGSNGEVTITVNDLCGITTASTTAYCTGTYNHNLVCCRNSELQKINMRWLSEDSYKEPGLLFLIEEINDIFCNDPRSRIECVLANTDYYEDVEWDNYAAVLLVTGFELPNKKHHAWNKPLIATVNQRGKIEDGAARHVYEYVGDKDALGFYAGLTVHDTCGSWSSYPAHEFEVEALCAPVKVYPEFSESFAYMTNPKYSWGLQIQSPAYGERKVEVFKDRDILSVPLGAHYSAGSPGCRLAYVWAYSGAKAKEY